MGIAVNWLMKQQNFPFFKCYVRYIISSHSNRLNRMPKINQNVEISAWGEFIQLNTFDSIKFEYFFEGFTRTWRPFIYCISCELNVSWNVFNTISHRKLSNRLIFFCLGYNQPNTSPVSHYSLFKHESIIDRKRIKRFGRWFFGVNIWNWRANRSQQQRVGCSCATSKNRIDFSACYSHVHPNALTIRTHAPNRWMRKKESLSKRVMSGSPDSSWLNELVHFLYY